MQTALEALRAELAQEGATTLQVLERVPRDKFSWRPHPKSMTLGQLALHVANIPGDFSRILAAPGVDFAEVDFDSSEPPRDVDLSSELERSLAAAREWLTALDEIQANAVWPARVSGALIFEAQRIALVRTLMFNHWYHHRGQLCVYIRMLDVPVPPIYGPTADENPFA